MKAEDITFVITTFKSESIIFDCINSLPESSPKIIVENSGNKLMKEELEKKYNNLSCFIMDSNLGYGRANNLGIKKSKTDYVFILNPDAKLPKNSLSKIIDIVKDQDFCIASPLESDKNNIKFNEKKFIDVDFVKGYAMLLNLKKINFGYFDEKIFLYLEEIDLCKRAINNNQRVLLLNVKIDHAGGFSHGSRDDIEMEKSRNWHWMWSKFYYNKKHFGIVFSVIKILPNLLSALFKSLIFYFFNKRKSEIYLKRLSGILNSFLGKKSWYRPSLD